MEGGIRAWNGLRAAGPPEAGMAYFEPAQKPEEMIALAWILEEGACRFYMEMGKRQKGPDEAALFRELSDDEEKHKSSLFKIYPRWTGKEAEPGFPRSLLSLESGDDYLEGGVVLNKALEWAQDQELIDLLDFSVSLEVNAIDLYIKMERKVEGDEAKELFRVLSNQERNRLKRLTEAHQTLIS
jgi:rubrerythrin